MLCDVVLCSARQRPLRFEPRADVANQFGYNKGAECIIFQCYTMSRYLLTYFLTPWCRVLLEKLTGVKPVKKFPAFHGTRRFIATLTSVRHLSLSWASPIQSIYPYPTSWRSILILFTHLRLGLPSGLLPSGFPTLYTPLSTPIRATCPAHNVTFLCKYIFVLDEHHYNSLPITIRPIF